MAPNNDRTQCAFVQGGTRGIGLALVEQLLQRPNVRRVFASARSEPTSGAFYDLVERFTGRLRFMRLDVTDEQSIRDAAQKVGQDHPHLHLLMNVAGVLHEGQMNPEKRLEDINPTHLERSFAVNAVGPLLMVKHFHSLLHHDHRAVVANLSARVGSIEDNQLGGWYGYRASKAAQNMFLRCAAIELSRRAPHVICLALHPGTVDTGLSKPFQRRVPKEKLFSPQRAATQLLAIVDGASAAQHGTFIAWDGNSIPW